jgi:hypothetical protein
MRNACRPKGRFFCLLRFLAVFVAMAAAAAQTNGPAMTTVAEGLFGHKSGNDKKNTALTLAANTIQMTDAIAGNEILDPGKFQDGLGKVIEGVVQCLNSSVWSKTKTSG